MPRPLVKLLPVSLILDVAGAVLNSYSHVPRAEAEPAVGCPAVGRLRCELSDEAGGWRARRSCSRVCEARRKLWYDVLPSDPLVGDETM